jgi:hypothetical protein
MESILTSIKESLGIEKDYEQFDPQIIMHTNTVFALLKRMGVGPSKGFSIRDAEAVWDDFMSEDPNAILEAAKTYVYLKVKMIFDPPTGSAMLEAMKENIKELEWSLNFEADAMADCEEVEIQNG